MPTNETQIREPHYYRGTLFADYVINGQINRITVARKMGRYLSPDHQGIFHLEQTLIRPCPDLPSQHSLNWRMCNWGCEGLDTAESLGLGCNSFDLTYENGYSKFISVGGPCVLLIKKLAGLTGIHFKYSYVADQRHHNGVIQFGILIVDPVSRRFSLRTSSTHLFSTEEFDNFRNQSLI